MYLQLWCETGFGFSLFLRLVTEIKTLLGAAQQLKQQNPLLAQAQAWWVSSGAECFWGGDGKEPVPRWEDSRMGSWGGWGWEAGDAGEESGTGRTGRQGGRRRAGLFGDGSEVPRKGVKWAAGPCVGEGGCLPPGQR